MPSSPSSTKLAHMTNKSKVIWENAESLVVSIRPVTGAICNCVLWLRGSTPTPLPFPWGQAPSDTMPCVIGPHKCTYQMASKSVEWFKQSARVRQTDRETDHATNKCVAMGRMACARTIPPIIFNERSTADVRGRRRRCRAGGFRTWNPTFTL